MTTPALPVTPALATRLSGRPLMLLLDVDGTLSPIAMRPDHAIVSPAMQQVLSGLTHQPDTYVAILSGRGADDARRLVGVPGLWTIGNHGMELAPPDAPAAVLEDVARFAHHIAAAAKRCYVIASTRMGVVVEDKRWTLSIHYRLAHPGIVPELTEQVSEVARDLGLRLTRGKEVLELRPPVDVDKGTAAVALAERLGAAHAGASVLCAGDDRTDEDAFRALRLVQPHAVTVRVGTEADRGETAAEFSVPDTDAMRELLEAVLARRRGMTVAR